MLLRVCRVSVYTHHGPRRWYAAARVAVAVALYSSCYASSAWSLHGFYSPKGEVDVRCRPVLLYTSCSGELRLATVTAPVFFLGIPPRGWLHPRLLTYVGKRRFVCFPSAHGDVSVGFALASSSLVRQLAKVHILYIVVLQL